MPKFQKESFLKSFGLFFIVIELFLVFISYSNLNVETHHKKLNLFLELKNYSYNFDDNRFNIDFVTKKDQKLYELQKDDKYLYILVDIKGEPNELLKIYYPIELFQKDINNIKEKIFIEFIALSIVSFIISILFSFYALYPLQNSYTILKEFMKDIIHDINTPLSAIKLNLQLIDNKSEEIQSIEQSLNTLEMLRKNLDNYLNDTDPILQNCSMEDILTTQINFFSNLYDWLDWQIDIEDEVVVTDRYLFSRVVYNLLNNSCKYNTTKGFVKVEYRDKILTIANSSYGIKNPNKVFNRFYKESQRGLGIGLHIVSKILKQLGYKYNLEIDTNNIVIIKITIL